MPSSVEKGGGFRPPPLRFYGSEKREGFWEGDRLVKTVYLCRDHNESAPVCQEEEASRLIVYGE
jgi:hypothetical protein